MKKSGYYSRVHVGAAVILISLALGVCSWGVAFSATVFLKSGEKIEGKVVKQTDKYIKLERAFGSTIYFRDSIDRIEFAPSEGTQLQQETDAGEESPSGNRQANETEAPSPSQAGVSNEAVPGTEANITEQQQDQPADEPQDVLSEQAELQDEGVPRETALKDVEAPRQPEAGAPEAQVTSPVYPPQVSIQDELVSQKEIPSEEASSVQTAIAGNVSEEVNSTGAEITRSELENLSTALELYKMDNADYPTTGQGLAALVKEPAAEPLPQNWLGPYLAKEPRDVWGNPFRYTYAGTGQELSLSSLGPDGIEGTADDIRP